MDSSLNDSTCSSTRNCAICGNMTIIDEDANNKIPLQESFKKFLEKKKLSKKVNASKQNALISRSDDQLSELRAKFIEKAKSYIGVPYARRYESPDSPIAPLYLDCCGLIRQVLWDLSDDFGFVIGKWNQAYQFDTLPIVLDEQAMQPGDLIFYEGEYYSTKSKPQKHNMVHVEIFLGDTTGEASLGSRISEGKVNYFHSYKMTSSKWKLIKYHYHSINTWLQGICQSYCSEHPWYDMSIVSNSHKKSIFYVEDTNTNTNTDTNFNTNTLITNDNNRHVSKEKYEDDDDEVADHDDDDEDAS